MEDLTKLRRRPLGLERHHIEHELQGAPRETYKGVDFVVAVGGPFEIHFPTNDLQRDLMREHPDGFYEYAWAVLADEVPLIGGFNVIDKNHDIDQPWTEAAREKARYNAARNAAKWAIDNGIADMMERNR